jgi:hypothetical protein
LLQAEEDGVPRTTFPEARAHALNFHDKPVKPETLLEFRIVPGRPDGQGPANSERCVHGSDACVVVKSPVSRRGEGRGTVVDIQQYHVELTGVRTQREADVPDVDPDTSVFQGVSR